MVRDFSRVLVPRFKSLSDFILARRWYLRAVQMPFLPGPERHDIEGAFMRGLEPDLRRAAFVMGLQEARGAKAPAVAGLQAGEVEFGTRRAEVVAEVFRQRQEFRGHHRADGVAAGVRGAGVAMAIAEEAGHRIVRTEFKSAAQYVGFGVFFQIILLCLRLRACETCPGCRRRARSAPVVAMTTPAARSM